MMDFISTDLTISAEEDILSCILLSPEAIEKAKMLPPEALTQTAHQLIFRAMLKIHESGGTTDLLSVTNYLHTKGNLLNVGGQMKLAALLDRGVPIVLLDGRIKMLEQHYHRRRLSNIQANLTTTENIPDTIAQLQDLQEKLIVTGDNDNSGDSHNLDEVTFSAIVTTVTKILKTGFESYEEQHKLEAIQKGSGLSNRAFWNLVTNLKTQLDEVEPSDEMRLNKLIDWSNASLDFKKALPTMADDILHDAKALNVDPIGIWQYLFPAVLSVAGKRVSLDVTTHTIPAIAWTAFVAESGTGKSRPEKLVLAPLKKLQSLERKRFEEEWEEYKEAQKNKKADAPEPNKPFAERKYLFEVATVQSILRRLSEQALNGTLWARDELAGLFKSLGQFTKGRDQEGLECLLKLWDGDSAQVDRVHHEDSFFIDETRLSIAGGIQPGAFRQAFKDASDSQGLQARFLFALVKTLPPRRTKAYCRLSDSLPDLYRWLDNLPETIIHLSREADALYDRLYEEIGIQAEHTSMPAIRAWMRKLSTQLLRIALALHLIECYHGEARLEELGVQTLKRAVLFAQYYRASFQVLQEKVADTDEISSILLKIWDAAVTRHPDGISVRDAYREIRAIQYRAKDAGQSAATYTANLFLKLEQMGKGHVKKDGRSIRFIANLNPDPIVPTPVVNPILPTPVTMVTMPTTLTQPESQVSPKLSLSPATIEIPEPVIEPEPVVEPEPVSEPEPEPHSTNQSEVMRVLEQEQGLPQLDGSLGLERVCDEAVEPTQTALPIHQRCNGDFVTSVPAANNQPFAPGDRVVTPEGEGTVDRYDEDFGEYNVQFDAPTSAGCWNGYFKPEHLTLIE